MYAVQYLVHVLCIFSLLQVVRRTVEIVPLWRGELLLFRRTAVRPLVMTFILLACV
jgi:hypothetical protein